ncbi:hypothetical protein C9993_04160 [Marinobacter sp. Z-F4-2]|nr:hypothetical protein C9993_04160 [Marinobacter sp. Z-F4-2]
MKTNERFLRAGATSACVFAILFCSWAQAQEKASALVTKQFITNNYLGSFKIKYSDEVSRTSYASGRVAFNPTNNSVFIDSHVYQLAIGEFAIPEVLSLSKNKEDLPNAEVIQGFTSIFSRSTTGNLSSLDRIGGMDIIDGRLFIQAYKTYDTVGSKQTTLVVENPNDLKTSTIDGFFEMQGAAHTVNYLSPVPIGWQSVLGGSYLAGNGGGMSIVTRLSAGPSLFVFSPEDFNKNEWNVSTRKWMDYPVEYALSSSVIQDNTLDGYGDWDATNNSGLNDLWTTMSIAAFGFIIPGTDSFFVVGRTGMLRSGGGYKIVNSEGYTCPGFCPYDNTDYNSYYWIYDMNEIVAAENPYAVLPYEYGVFDDRWMEYGKEGAQGAVTGGSYDANTGTLVLSHGSATSYDGAGSPIISVYKLPVISPPKSPDSLRIN